MWNRAIHSCPSKPQHLYCTKLNLFLNNTQQRLTFNLAQSLALNSHAFNGCWMMGREGLPQKSMQKSWCQHTLTYKALGTKAITAVLCCCMMRSVLARACWNRWALVCLSKGRYFVCLPQEVRLSYKIVCYWGLFPFVLSVCHKVVEPAWVTDLICTGISYRAQELWHVTSCIWRNDLVESFCLPALCYL